VELIRQQPRLALPGLLHCGGQRTQPGTDGLQLTLLQRGELGQGGELLLPGGPELGAEAALQVRPGSTALPQGEDQGDGDQDHHEDAQEQLRPAHAIFIRFFMPWT
jgi:hypothetical protein